MSSPAPAAGSFLVLLAGTVSVVFVNCPPLSGIKLILCTSSLATGHNLWVGGLALVTHHVTECPSRDSLRDSSHDSSCDLSMKVHRSVSYFVLQQVAHV